MGLLDKRLVYSPREYPQADEFWLKQQTSHWIHTEVELDEDKNDWKNKLTDSEKEVIAKTLKGFTQAEILIEDYWATKVRRWFKKPEIQDMAACFANMESVHVRGYAFLQEELGLTDFDAFLHEPAAKARIDRLLSTKGKTREDMARSLAIFSAFNEGVSLFSSFAILLSFSRRNLLKNIGRIIGWSIMDEQLHSLGGVWLFKTLVNEYPEIFTDSVKEDIYEAARLTVKLEDDFIDSAFLLGEIESINPEDLKAFIRSRTNQKLKELTLSPLYKNLDQQKVDNIASWFYVMAKNLELQDFFAGNVVSYSKALTDFSEISFDGIE